MKKWINIFLIALLVITVALMAFVVASPHSEDPTQYDLSVSICLYWGYALLVLGALAAVFGAVFGMVQNPASIKSFAGAAVLIVAIIGVAYFISASHTVNIPNLADGGFFGHTETVITETCVYVTYVAFAAAFLTALVTEVWRAFK